MESDLRNGRCEVTCEQALLRIMLFHMIIYFTWSSIAFRMRVIISCCNYLIRYTRAIQNQVSSKNIINLLIFCCIFARFSHNLRYSGMSNWVHICSSVNCFDVVVCQTECIFVHQSILLSNFCVLLNFFLSRVDVPPSKKQKKYFFRSSDFFVRVEARVKLKFRCHLLPALGRTHAMLYLF